MRYFNTLGTRFSGRGDTGINTMVFTKAGYTRAFVVPVQPNTILQGTVKGRFAVNTSSWNGLALDVQQGWNDAATSGAWGISDTATGTVRNPSSGKVLYQQVNANVGVVNGTAASIDNAPMPEPAGTTVLGGVSALAADPTGIVTVSVDFTGALGTNESHVLYLTGLQSGGTTKLRKSDLRQAAVSTGAAPGFDLTTSIVTTTPGLRLGFKLDAINVVTGQRRSVGQGVIEIEIEAP